MTNVSHITVSCQSLNGATAVYLNHSTDNETFTPLLPLDEGESAQGSALDVTNGNTFTFPTCSGYFAIIFKFTDTSGAWNINDPIITFKTDTIPTVYLDQTHLSGSIGDKFEIVATPEDFIGNPGYVPSLDYEGSSDLVSITAEDSHSPNVFTVEIIGSPNYLIQVTITITVSSDRDDPATATCILDVYASNPTGVSVTDSSGATSGSAVINDKVQLTGTVLPKDAYQKVTWASNNEGVATVDENGLVTAISAGVVTITATSSDDNTKSATYTLTVSEEQHTYDLVTSESSLVLGNSYAIAANSESKAISATQGEDRRSGADVTIENGQFTVNDASNTVASFILTAGIDDGSYAFYDSNNNGYLCAGSGTGNYLLTESTLSRNSSFTITIASDGTISAKIQAKDSNNSLRYYLSSNSFICTDDGASDVAVSLFADASLENEGTAAKWASDFLTASSAVCSASADLSDPETLMGDLSIADLPVYAQDTLKHATSENATGDLAKALERYDFIVSKYTDCTDVLGRRATSPALGLFNWEGEADDGAALDLILILSLLGAFTLLSIMVVRTKRKGQ